MVDIRLEDHTMTTGEVIITVLEELTMGRLMEAQLTTERLVATTDLQDQILPGIVSLTPSSNELPTELQDQVADTVAQVQDLVEEDLVNNYQSSEKEINHSQIAKT